MHLQEKQKMKSEIEHGVEFICNNIFKTLNESELKVVYDNLKEILEERYKGHWSVDKPLKGQAYRSISYKKNSKLDPVFELLMEKCSSVVSRQTFDSFSDFTLWIDPGEVSCRFGDALGNTFIIAKFDVNKNESSLSNEQSKEQQQQQQPNKQQQSTQQQQQQQQMNDINESFINSNILSDLYLSESNSNSNIFEQVQPFTYEQRLSHNQRPFKRYQQQQPQQQQYPQDNYLNVFEFASFSPSSSSSISFNSNASDGTRTPISCYGDSASERSETPSSSINNSFNEPTTMINTSSSNSSINTINTNHSNSPSPSPSNVATNNSNNNSNNNNAVNGNNGSQGGNKSGAYCGYVESYPYYYKLNRLYNALAIQKMEAERLKKFTKGKFNNTNSNNSTTSNNHNKPQKSNSHRYTNNNHTNAINIPASSVNRNLLQSPSSSVSTSPSNVPYSHQGLPFNPYYSYHQQQQQQPQQHHGQQFTPSTSPLFSSITQSQSSNQASISLPTQTQQTTLPNNYDPMTWIRGSDLVKSKN